ncbi:hypothetical protein M422DRAFT_251551 [Sphaerobolus stellatus SS14]|uniref:Uncharacterized protein n=1 Tax=Sphaerobolus stellatus (strain SS14) TaxID=990650 RepID=A0A0C9VRE2_SPHS4|nr:hypothetical protein M422DRAFT_251551 [Sphaerobolus stellatus SS14]
MPLQDPANAQVIYARAYGPLLIAILISTFMYGVSLSFVLQYFKLEAKRDPSVLKVAILLLMFNHDLFSIFSSVSVSSFKANTSHLVDKLTARNREDMHAPTLPHSLLNYFSPAEFGQVKCFPVSKSLHSQVRLMAVLVILLGLLQMVYAINRGIVTSICALLGASLVSFVALGWDTANYLAIVLSRPIHLLLILPLANPYLYVISAVSILTSREGLREEINQSFHLSDLTSRSDATNGRQNVPSDFTEDKIHQTV